jgi:hypothetical protein
MSSSENHRNSDQKVLTRGWGGEIENHCLMSVEFQFCKMKLGGGGCTTCEHAELEMYVLARCGGARL